MEDVIATDSGFLSRTILSDLADLTDLKVDFYSLLLWVSII